MREWNLAVFTLSMACGADPAAGKPTGADDTDSASDADSDTEIGSEPDCPSDLPMEGCPCESLEPVNCFTGAPGEPGEGRCQGGVQTCIGAGEGVGVWGPCEGEVLPEAELCNAFDDDCNGVADDEIDCTPVVETHPCVGEPSIDAFSAPAMEAHWGVEAPDVFPRYVQSVTTPVVGNFVEEIDEAVPEIVIVTYDVAWEAGVLRVIEGRAPHDVLWTDAGWGNPDADDVPRVNWNTHPALGDLDGDGWPEVVVAKQSGGGLLAYTGDGEILWESDEPQLSEGTDGWSTYDAAAIAIADLEGDGTPEVVLGRTVLEWDGTLRWTGSGAAGYNYQGPISCIADLDGDGALEIVAGRTAYRSDGTIFWDRGAGDTPEGFCAIADLYDTSGAGDPVLGRDGVPEVVRVWGATVAVLRGGDGSEISRWDHPSATAWWAYAGPPTVADFDGDGLAEIGVAGADRYAVWDVDTGTTLWEQPTDDTSSSVTASTVFDFNGDGTSEVIYNDEEYFRVYNGPDGEVLFEEPNPSRTRTEEPVVADVDADGNAEIVFIANAETSFAGDHIAEAERLPGLQIWGSADDAWVPARTIWNEHTYHIDNVEEDGTIPAAEAQSWVDHNTYRANRPGDLLDYAPDLTAAGLPFDETLCYARVLRVCAEIQNTGEQFVGPGLLVTFYEGDPLAGGVAIGSTETRETLDPGLQETVCVDWPDAPVEPTAVWIDVDVRGEARECDELNNVVFLGEGRCPGIE
jgi:hypothetical protein